MISSILIAFVIIWLICGVFNFFNAFGSFSDMPEDDGEYTMVEPPETRQLLKDIYQAKRAGQKVNVEASIKAERVILIRRKKLFGWL